MTIKSVDICCGLAWGDEAKGKLVSYLAKLGKYDYICRWSWGNNAGHTIYIDGKKYKTHLIPSGIFYNIKCIIGPDCIVNKRAFLEEIAYLKSHNFNTNLIKISPNTHLVTEEHIEEDIQKYSKTQGSTSRGIAHCYRDKYGRTSSRVKDTENFEIFKKYIWDGELSGNILCEGAQGFWLDINWGNYPFVTSSCTLPYSACSLGFPPQFINKIYGCIKIYDTRSWIDPDFPEELLNDTELNLLGELGEEYGVTTNRRRKVNWLNLNKALKAINISGTTNLIISKIDIIKKVNIFKIIYNDQIKPFSYYKEMEIFLNNKIKERCPLIKNITYSDNPENISLKE